MTHILTVALDLNAATREIAGSDLLAELSAVVASEGITHITLAAPRRGRLAPLARPTLADRLLDRHPHLELHLLRPT